MVDVGSPLEKSSLCLHGGYKETHHRHRMLHSPLVIAACLAPSVPSNDLDHSVQRQIYASTPEGHEQNVLEEHEQLVAVLAAIPPAAQMSNASALSHRGQSPGHIPQKTE